MKTLEDRIGALELSNKRLRRCLYTVAVMVGCCLLSAAGADESSAVDNLLVRKRLVVGGGEIPAVVLESKDDAAGVAIIDKQRNQRASMIYRPEARAVAFTIKDENGSVAFEAIYRETGIEEKPLMAVNLKQTSDKGGLSLMAGPGGRVGVAIRDEQGELRSRLDKSGAFPK